MNGNKRTGIDIVIFVCCLLAGMLLGRIVMNSFNTEVEQEVEKVLSKVVMIDVPPIDTTVANYLEENEYIYKYLTAIDTYDNSYGIYEIKNGEVIAYAHGKCEDTGDADPGFYEIVDTKSHIDYHNVRYWRVVNLKEKSTKQDLVVSSSGYVIDEIPIEKVPNEEGFGNIQIDSEIMLTVYDNSEPGIVLIVINSGDKKE